MMQFITWMTFQTANEVTINDLKKNTKLVFMQARFNNKKNKSN